MLGLGRSQRICGSCRHWQVENSDEGDVLGECRVDPPKLHPRAGASEDADTMSGLPRRPWPLTEARDWCAAWRPTSNAPVASERVRKLYASSPERHVELGGTAQKRHVSLKVTA
jgi:hypothetical protein